MARRPPPGCGLRALPALLLLLLLRPPATPGVTCPPPTSVKHADIRVKSYDLNSTERYTCNAGFKRKAGTSSLTECVLNTTTNTAHWTIPNLKCIRDPSLTHLKPSSTEVPTRVTPEPEGTSLSGKEPAFTSKSDSTLARKATTEPGSRPIPSEPPAAGTTGVISNELSQAPAQTTAKALEHTTSASQETPGTYSYSSRTVTVTAAIFTPVAVLCIVGVGLLLCHKRSRQTSQIPGVEMENMEEMPMTGGTNGREEDAAAEAETRAPPLP